MRGLDLQQVLQYLANYGVIFMFIVVYLEYLNMPGVPSGVVMPAAGMLISKSNLSFLSVVIVSVLAGVLGSITLYYIGYFIGQPFLNYCNKKFPKAQKATDKIIKWNEKHGGKEIFIARLIPFLRTFISAISGVFRINVFQFVTYSVVGIVIWNTSLVTIGYLFGDMILSRFM